MEMPGWLDLLGGMIDRTAGFWQGLGNLETRAFAAELEDITIDRPIYVTGLARAGTTILLELLAAQPGIATHQYRDFPPLYTPIFWSRAFAHIWRADTAPVERAHKDRILVTPMSPEAMEEVLWMRFFPDSHRPGRSHVLDAGTRQPAFERFYREHIQKILFIRQGRRYLSKGNYNLSRLRYLQGMFPSARFVIPVREPLWHIASLMKQHRLFCAEEARDARILKHMRRVGHYEFGLDRRAIDLGDGIAAEVERLWREGDEVRAWARYWNSLYRFVAGQGAADRALAEATLIVRYEDLCDRGEATLGAVFDHVGLPLGLAERRAAAARLSRPSYYAPGFTPEEQSVIAAETQEARAALGYP